MSDPLSPVADKSEARSGLILAAACWAVAACSMLFFLLAEPDGIDLTLLSLAVAFAGAVIGLKLFFSATSGDAARKTGDETVEDTRRRARILSWTNTGCGLMAAVGISLKWHATTNSYLDAVGQCLFSFGAIIPLLAYRYLHGKWPF